MWYGLTTSQELTLSFAILDLSVVLGADGRTMLEKGLYEGENAR